MKKKIISMLCIIVASFTIMTSCSIREEDYEQAIVNEWELEKYTWRHKFYESETGTFEWGTIVYSDFEEPIRISFKSDGTCLISKDTEILYTGIKWTILADCLNFNDGGPVWWGFVYCNSEVTEGTGGERRIELSDIRLRENVTIEQLTRTKLVLFQGDENGKFERFVFKKI